MTERIPRSCRPPFPHSYQGQAFRWQLGEIETLLAWGQSELDALKAELGPTWHRMVDWTPGLSSPQLSFNGGSTADDGSEPGPTQAAALAKLTNDSSGPAVDMHIIVSGAVKVVDILARMKAAKLRLRAAEPVGDVMEPDPRSGVGECSNVSCGAWCSGEGRDRRKSGLCPACYAYRARRLETHASPEDLIRPHEVCHPDPIDGCRQCARRELLEQGHAPDEVVGLVDDRVKR